MLTRDIVLPLKCQCILLLTKYYLHIVHAAKHCQLIRYN